MDEDTTVTVHTGKKRGKWQGTIEIEKGTMKLKVRLPLPKCSSSSLTSEEEPLVKKIRKEKDINNNPDSGNKKQKKMWQKARIQ